ncbi:phenylacetate--CoA ligase family protein [bacterium]|nr:phenylacetate--CoA ligase family protein [bacterium]
MGKIHEFIFKLGARRRNPSLFNLYNDLKESESWDRTRLESLQLSRLRELLSFAKEYSIYYRSILSNINIDQFKTEDLQKLPILLKKDLITKGDEIHTQFKFQKVFKCETSGTSGEVLKFNRNEEWDSFNRAVMMRGYSWYDVKPSDFNIYFWGYNFSGLKRLKLRFSDCLVNRWRIFDYSEESIQKAKRKIKKAVYIEGYSSMIYELAKMFKDSNIVPSKLKMIKGTSEKIHPHYQEVAEQAFGMPIRSEYGAAEAGLIAFECPEGNMHITLEGCIVETTENNEILVTNLFSKSFPIIRYKLGDAVRLKSNEYTCACGMKHPIIEEVTGRVGAVITGHKSKYPSLTLYYIFKSMYFDHNIQLNYQGHQYENGLLEIWLDRELSSEERELLLEKCLGYFKADVDVTLMHKKDFRQEQGKLRDFIDHKPKIQS